MIRVLMITASASYGGGPQHIYDLAMSLRGRVFIDIACPRQEPFYERFRNVIDGEIIEIPERRFAFLDVSRLLRFAQRNRVTILHSHGKGAGLYGRLVSAASQIPLVHTPHGIHIDQYRGFMRALYLGYERFAGLIDAKTIFVSPSEFYRARVLGIGRQSRSCLVCNGVSSQNNFVWQHQTRARLRFQLGIKEQDILIVSLSRFDYAKNMLEMVDIARELPTANFLVLGDGPDYEEVKLKASKLVVNNLQLPGFVCNPIDYLAAADIYCSTSRWEGLPLAVLQAMSLSVPVVASSVIGNRDAVAHGESGYLYQLGNVEEAVKYINALLADSGKRSQFGEQGKIRQNKEFSLSRMADRTLNIYNSINFRG